MGPKVGNPCSFKGLDVVVSVLGVDQHCRSVARGVALSTKLMMAYLTVPRRNHITSACRTSLKLRTVGMAAGAACAGFLYSAQANHR